ncbi:MAG TPA: hypothetical protein VGD58_34010 [Herpetosiphonaceae bacterium]
MNGRYRNSQTWIYILALIGVLVAVYVVYRLLTAGLQSYLALIAGVMLLIGNFPDLVRSVQQRRIDNSMLNTFIGLGLVTYFIGSIVLAPLFWSLSIVMLIAALPLTLNRASVSKAYINGFRTLFMQARHLFRYRERTM